MSRSLAPRHPGQILLEEYLDPREMTQSELALRLGVPFPRVNEVVRGRRGITADTALRLEEVFGTPAEEWMAWQGAWEVWRAREERGRDRRRRRGERGGGRRAEAAPQGATAPLPAEDEGSGTTAAPAPGGDRSRTPVGETLEGPDAGSVVTDGAPAAERAGVAPIHRAGREDPQSVAVPADPADPADPEEAANDGDSGDPWPQLELL